MPDFPQNFGCFDTFLLSGGQQHLDGNCILLKCTTFYGESSSSNEVPEAVVSCGAEVSGAW
jgi:hypothetical protein